MITYNRGDLILVNNESAVGNIQSGTRPYLIISNDKANTYSNIITAIPTTTQEKTSLPTHYTIEINGLQNTFLAEQITCISKDNVISYLGKIDSRDLYNIEKRVKVQLGLTDERGKTKIAGTRLDRRFTLLPNEKENLYLDFLQLDNGETPKIRICEELAKKYNVSKGWVSNIIREKQNQTKGA